MRRADIYIEIENTSPKASEKWYGYILECKVDGETKTREGFGKIEGTYHQAVLTALIEALERFRESCEVHVHTENEFILNMIDMNLEKWAGNEFQTSRGKLVANQEEWVRIWGLSNKQLLITEHGDHEYASWLESAIRREKEKGEIGTGK